MRGIIRAWVVAGITRAKATLAKRERRTAAAAAAARAVRPRLVVWLIDGLRTRYGLGGLLIAVVVHGLCDSNHEMREEYRVQTVDSSRNL
jgi:hypothetical protein